jgi:hypothetical protein
MSVASPKIDLNISVSLPLLALVNPKPMSMPTTFTLNAPLSLNFPF